MNNGPQYNEREIIQRFFRGKRHGILVEVGAADGITNSHTAYLIDEYEWGALLIEPHPDFFHQCYERYKNLHYVMVVQKAISKQEGVRDFYLKGQISRFDQLEDAKMVQVECIGLSSLLNSINAKHFDFLSIDAEGTDLEVLDTLDWNRWHPSLVCVEHNMGIDVLKNHMKQYNYVLVASNNGNSFFQPEDENMSIE